VDIPHFVYPHPKSQLSPGAWLSVLWRWRLRSLCTSRHPEVPEQTYSMHHPPRSKFSLDNPHYFYSLLHITSSINNRCSWHKIISRWKSIVWFEFSQGDEEKQWIPPLPVQHAVRSLLSLICVSSSAGRLNIFFKVCLKWQTTPCLRQWFRANLGPVTLVRTSHCSACWRQALCPAFKEDYPVCSHTAWVH
jgi:hypothetical protein